MFFDTSSLWRLFIWHNIWITYCKHRKLISEKVASWRGLTLDKSAAQQRTHVRNNNATSDLSAAVINYSTKYSREECVAFLIVADHILYCLVTNEASSGQSGTIPGFRSYKRPTGPAFSDNYFLSVKAQKIKESRRKTKNTG